ncbi:MAG: 23S rRNA (pseudouridine(1915)-N(3))-methyltransferase RlmH [Marinilabiliales bacterium]|nr:MAG: 23S rRNA (pseudouridine(1915)-N(3))-methyltransferase RlmH [Marinilabiliales bacterium]
MKITLVFTGRTEEKYISEGIDIYIDRLKHYIPVEIKIAETPGKKRRSRKGSLIMTEPVRQPGSSLLMILDEKGKKFNSVEFSKLIESAMTAGYKELVFYTGGAWGFPEKTFEKADRVISLSDMTFTHQMVRLILVEQIYRAMTIIRGEPYHHQ